MPGWRRNLDSALDPETEIKRQFLVDHSETDNMDQFLDPETDIMGKRTFMEKLAFIYMTNSSNKLHNKANKDTNKV